MSDPLIPAGCRLDLSQFDSKASELHLGVDAPEEFQLPVLVIPRQIAGAVHLRVLPVKEWTGYKLFICQRLLLPVAFRDLSSGQAQFSRHPLRQQVPVFIADERPCIRHGAADGNIHILVLINNMIGRTDRKLRRPVAVDQPDPRLCAGQHFFSAHHYVSKLQIRILVHHGHADLSGHGERRDMMPLDVIPHPGHIPAQLIRKDMYRASGGQRADQVVQRSVKGKAGMYGVDAVTAYSKLMDPPGRERAKRAMTLYHALRLSGGA